MLSTERERERETVCRESMMPYNIDWGRPVN